MKLAQDPPDYDDKCERLSELQTLAAQGQVELFYGDAAGFCLTSPIPYGWQFAGEQVATRPRYSPRLNVLGFFNAATNALFTVAREGCLDAAFVINALDTWATTRTRPTVLILDNASLHHTAAFAARRLAWEEHNLFIFYLPTYSPHLNKIETLWRKIKYEWLRPEAYRDFSTLKAAVWNILDQVGQKYRIRFET